MSYLSPLSSCSTPGWNDPPTVVGHTKTASSRGTGALTNRHRRPIHPSIQSSNNPAVNPNLVHHPVLSSHQAAIPPVAPNQIPVAASFQGAISEVTPQPVIPAPLPNNAAMDSFFPCSASPSRTRMTNSRSFDEKSLSTQQHRSIFDAFTVPGSGQQQVQPASAGLTLQSSGNKHPRIPSEKSLDLSMSTSSYVHPTPPIETNPNALIYVPPNVIGDNNRRPSTSPCAADYVAPVKAAGDVSLSGVQLVHFLIKATYKLPAGVTRDGIQLRINQLNELTSSGQITDSCIKKLNFVVDALDRGLFDEAHQFFEQFQASFPMEARTSWAQGIRLLLKELRRPPRSGSAGRAPRC